MTENELRAKVVDIAKAYLGTAEGSAKHKEIIDTYNGYSDPNRRAGLYHLRINDVRHTDQSKNQHLSADSFEADGT